MAINEQNRHDLYAKLEEVLGRDNATTMMEHLPPVGWADVATKADLAALEERIGLRFALVDQRFDYVDHRFAQVDQRFEQVDGRLGRIETRLDSLDHRIGEQTKTIVFSMAGLFIAFAGVVLGAVTLA